MKSILLAAGTQKRKNKEMKEELLVLKALINVNIPKLNLMDKDLFMGILQDLFPGKQIQKETDQ